MKLFWIEVLMQKQELVSLKLSIGMIKSVESNKRTKQGGTVTGKEAKGHQVESTNENKGQQKQTMEEAIVGNHKMTR